MSHARSSRTRSALRARPLKGILSTRVIPLSSSACRAMLVRSVQLIPERREENTPNKIPGVPKLAAPAGFLFNK